MVRRVDSAGGTATDSSERDESESTTETVLPGSETAAAGPARAVAVQTDSSVDVLAATGRGAQVVPSTQHAEFPVPSWDRYEFLSLIGRGGMGAVYKARDRRLDRVVALKFLRIDDPSMVARFQREASTQARLEHPNICRVFEVGEVEHKPYIAMQFVDGKTLDQAAHSLSLHEKVTLIKQVALALHEAHRLGIVHRDIKPSNIMVVRGSDGMNLPLVMDFGIAHEAKENAGLTETGAVMGTPAYMSPEQARGGSRSVDRRADVYSLGATLYELLTGKPPFGGPDVVAVLLSVLNDEPRTLRDVVPDLPRDLETIVLKCLAKDAGQRYDSARALSEDLQRYIDGEPILGKRVSLLFRLRRQYRKHKALFALSVVAVVTIAAITGVGVRERIRSQRQAELAQKLGQEISQMEWLLRSARQLPLHNLEREKGIIRRRMLRLEDELSSYGGLGKGLAHYALGRGHLALHEYPQALKALLAAQASGNQSADVHYALGLVLGKHYEQAMYEARLSGGGDWAEKQLLELRPRYLLPAIESLQKSRALASETQGYLEAMIAYYRRDYDGALQKAQAVAKDAPWLYEAEKLQGDIHLERALSARDSGKDDDARREFAASVGHYQAAARIGQSDSENYEGLAEAWVRQVEMAATRGQPTEEAYAAAMETSDKITAAEPGSTAGPLKKAYAALLTMAISGSGTSSVERVQKCMLEAQAVLAKEPENPYASDVAAGCNAFAADSAQGRGEDPEPLFRRAIALLEPAIARAPYFLWGINDLASTYLAYASYLQLHGHPETRGYFEKAIAFQKKAMSLDDNYLIAKQNALYTLYRMIMIAQTRVELDELLKQADALYGSCIEKNSQFQQCNINYLAVYTRAAQRLSSAQQDSDLAQQRAVQTLARARAIGGSFLDLEQNAALLYVLDAQEKLARKQNATTALLSAEQTIQRCLGLSGQDAMCRTLLAQVEWLKADRAVQQKQPTTPHLQVALAKAFEATQRPEVYPDAWQVLAESNLRLARESKEPLRIQYAQAGHAALAKAFAINPNHAKGRATEGELLLLAAEDAKRTNKRELAEAALSALEKSANLDPLAAPALVAAQKRARLLATQN